MSLESNSKQQKYAHATGFKFYCIVSALLIIAGETWFVVTTDKYPPLWLDDYFIAGALLLSSRYWSKAYGPALALACWAFIAGNLYAMLFGRLEPINPPDRPWLLLAILVVWATVSSVIALYHVIQRSKL